MNDGGRKIIYSPTHAASMRGLLSILLLNSAEPRILIIMSATSSYYNYQLMIVSKQLEKCLTPTAQAKPSKPSSRTVLVSSSSHRNRVDRSKCMTGSSTTAEAVSESDPPIIGPEGSDAAVMQLSMLRVTERLNFLSVFSFETARLPHRCRNERS